MAEMRMARGRGRGRGWIIGQDVQEPLKPTTNREFLLLEIISDLCKKSKLDSQQVMEVSNIAQSSQTDLIRVVNTIHSLCLAHDDYIVNGVDLCIQLIMIDVDGIKFRGTLLNIFQKDFEDREHIRKKSKEIFMNCVHFFCVAFNKLRLSGSVYPVLILPVVTYLTMLSSADATDEEFTLFCKLLKMCGPDLVQVEAYKTLLQNVRLQILSESVSSIQKAALLEILELSAHSWKPLSADTVKFYESLMQY